MAPHWLEDAFYSQVLKYEGKVAVNETEVKSIAQILSTFTTEPGTARAFPSPGHQCRSLGPTLKPVLEANSYNSFSASYQFLCHIFRFSP